MYAPGLHAHAHTIDDAHQLCDCATAPASAASPPDRVTPVDVRSLARVPHLIGPQGQRLPLVPRVEAFRVTLLPGEVVRQQSPASLRYGYVLEGSVDIIFPEDGIPMTHSAGSLVVHRDEPWKAGTRGCDILIVDHLPAGSASGGIFGPGGFSRTLANTSLASDGAPLCMPEDPQLAVSLVTIDAGAQLPVHLHPWPRYGYVLKGCLQVLDEATRQRRDYPAGQLLLEMQDRWHSGRNPGPEPLEVLVIDHLPGRATSNTVLRPDPVTAVTARSTAP